MSRRSSLVGREAERSVLGGLIDTVHAGRSAVLVLRGDPGIGKTALLTDLVERASGCRVVQAAAVESEIELPFAALHQMCGPMLDRIDALPQPQRDAIATAFGLASGRSPDRLLIGLAVLTLLSQVCEAAPVVCVVDDAHCLDRESAMVLGFVARRLLAERVALVFAAREPVPEFAGLAELPVLALHERDARRLLNAALHVPLDDPVRLRVIAESRGNPLALLEWARELTPTQLAGGFGVPSVLPMAGQLEERFRARVRDLPHRTQQFLTVAAADPTADPVVVWRAAGALGVEPHDASPAIDAGLVELDIRLRFPHPLVRSAAYKSPTADDRRAAHRALAEATDPDRDPDRRAWHRALGAPGPDEDIAAALERSANSARARGGLSAAAALLERSVALTGDPSQRGARILAAAGAHLEAGSFDAAAGLLASAEAAQLDEWGRVRLDMLRGRFASARGDVRDAPALLLRAATRVEPLDPSTALDTYLKAIGAAVLTGVFANGVTTEDVARRALACPVPAAPSVTETLVIGLAQLAVEGADTAAPILRNALQAATRASDIPFFGFGFLAAAASVLWERDALERASDLLLSATRELGSLTMLPWALNTVALLRTLEGDLGGASALIAEANEIVAATGGNLGMEWSHAILAAFRAEDDALSSIGDLADAARVAGNGQALTQALWARAIVHNSNGEHERALAAGADAMRQASDWGSHTFLPEQVEAAVRCRRPRLAAAALERLRGTTEPSGTDWAVGIQRRAEALLAPDARAEDLYREAIERLVRTKVRPDLARGHLLYGEWLGGVGRLADSRVALRTAFALYSEMGIEGFAGRARRRLLESGEKVRLLKRDVFHELTQHEAQIARLAAEGRTNVEIAAQLFLSPRTVEWHLRKVFGKLGVASRRELLAALPRN